MFVSGKSTDINIVTFIHHLHKLQDLINLILTSTFTGMSRKSRVNPFNKKVCHCIDDRHGYFSFLTHHKGKNT